MMNKIKQKFTSWYVKRGYRFGYEGFPLKAYYKCPAWVRPLLFLFSPSVYFQKEAEKIIKIANESLLSINKAREIFSEFFCAIQKAEKDGENDATQP